MNQVSLPNCLLSKRQDVEIVVLAHSGIEIELAFYVSCSHHGVVIFVPDLFINQAVSLVFLCVSADFTGKLCFYPSEIQYLGLLFLRLRVPADFAPPDLA